jgi:hypothetical protein
LATPDKRQYVAPKKHFYDANTAPCKVPSKHFLEGVAVVYAEASVGPAGETTIVLVEANVQKFAGLSIR